MMSSKRHLGIIGGGIAGLTVAFRRALLGDRVTLFEASARLGGQLQSERSGGFLIEHGAEGFVAGSSALAELARALGIQDALLDQRLSESLYFDGQKLSVLPPGEAGKLLGFQVPARAFGRGIQSFALGMDQLVLELAARLPPHARCTRRSAIEKVARAGEGWDIVPAAGATVRVDDVVIATGASAAASLLSPEFGEAARSLADSEAMSSVTVSLAYEREHVHHALDATGFVVAEGTQLEGFRACTFASSKLPGRAPRDRALLRSFFRPSPEDLAQLGDAEWTDRAVRALRSAITLDGPPISSWVSRWESALPVFDPPHRDRVVGLERALAGSRVWLAGAAFHGSGIDGAVRSAEATARALDGAAPQPMAPSSRT